jgi:hypothetical protein
MQFLCLAGSDECLELILLYCTGAQKYAVFTICYIGRLLTAGTAERACRETIAGAQKMLK